MPGSRSRGSHYDAVVVGSGPNGLAAAITIARAGRPVLVMEAKDSVGGGMRTAALTLPGFLHDVCSAVHPLAVSSPFFLDLDLSVHGLAWAEPPVPLAHPLDDGTALLLHRSVEETALGLGEDGDAYRRVMAGLVRDCDALVQDLLKPLHWPAHPLTFTRFGMKAMYPSTYLARTLFRGQKAQALFAGNSAHSVMPLEQPFTSAFGLMLSMIGHRRGWPAAMGGSGKFAEALASHFRALGGEITLNSPVLSIENLPPARAYLFDTTPRQLAAIAGERFPAAFRKKLKAYRYGPGVFKVDWALDGPIPWKDTSCLEAGTLHLGGTLAEIAASERGAWGGRSTANPFVILCQPSLFDAGRAPAGKHTAWAYCHVPNGSTADMTQAIESQVERFAPGFRDRILARHCMSPSDMEAYNENYIGGDIVGGANTFMRLILGPLRPLRPYSTPVKGLYLCSASTPPGGGVHGMCGYLAALQALEEMI